MTLFDQRPSTLIRWVILALPALPMLDPLFGDDAGPFTGCFTPPADQRRGSRSSA